MKDIRSELIEKHLWSFGFLPLLLVLEILEDEEHYQWCNTILEVLRKHSKKYDFDIPKRYSIEAIIQMKINFMAYHGLSGDIAEKNSVWYATAILLDIVSINQPQPIQELSEFDKVLKKCLDYNPNQS